MVIILELGLKCKWTIKATVRPRSSSFYYGSSYFKQGDTIKISHGGYFARNAEGKISKIISTHKPLLIVVFNLIDLY